jgi:ATP/maltotriose-dependent transcriptional regulator MalT
MRTTPIVMNDRLITYREAIRLDSPQWYEWLETHPLFAFQSQHGKFTARKELHARGGEYWKAYRKREGKLYRLYLGKSENLTYDSLQSAAEILAERSADHQNSRPIAQRAVDLRMCARSSILSAREREILCLVEYGMSNKEIAEHLIITLNTVKEHLKHIYVKLDVQNRTSAINRARLLGLLEA